MGIFNHKFFLKKFTYLHSFVFFTTISTGCTDKDNQETTPENKLTSVELASKFRAFLDDSKVDDFEKKKIKELVEIADLKNSDKDSLINELRKYSLDNKDLNKIKKSANEKDLKEFSLTYLENNPRILNEKDHDRITKIKVS